MVWRVDDGNAGGNASRDEHPTEQIADSAPCLPAARHLSGRSVGLVSVPGLPPRSSIEERYKRRIRKHIVFNPLRFRVWCGVWCLSPSGVPIGSRRARIPGKIHGDPWRQAPCELWGPVLQLIGTGLIGTGTPQEAVWLRWGPVPSLDAVATADPRELLGARHH